MFLFDGWTNNPIVLDREGSFFSRKGFESVNDDVRVSFNHIVHWKIQSTTPRFLLRDCVACFVVQRSSGNRIGGVIDLGIGVITPNENIREWGQGRCRGNGGIVCGIIDGPQVVRGAQLRNKFAACT